MRRYRRDALALSALVLLILAFFWPLLSGRYLIPRGGGDLVSFLWPTYRFAARSLRQGVVPLWNPTLYAGMPFAADNQSGLFYPPNLLLFLIGGEPGYGAMEALVVLHMVLAGVLMYLLLRDRGLTPSASVLGGLSFALSDLFVTHIGNLNLNATIAYLPGIVLLADRALLRRSLGYAAAAGALLAVAALAGHGQMLTFLGMSLAILVLYASAGLSGKAEVPQQHDWCRSPRSLPSQGSPAQRLRSCHLSSSSATACAGAGSPSRRPAGTPFPGRRSLA